MINVKKDISKMIKLVVLCALIVLMIPTAVFANGDMSGNSTPTESNASQAEKTLKTYLDAAKQENMGQMVSNSVDTRFTQATVDAAYKRAFGYKRDQLLSYTLTSETQNSDGFEFMTKLSFNDGNTLDVPFEVVQKNNSWKVLITTNSLKQNVKSTIYVVKPSSSSETTSTVSPKTYTSSTGEIASWNISSMLVNGSNWYSNATFSPNSAGYNECTLNLQQWSEYPGDTAWIDYAIVVQHWYGDYVWGNPITVQGNNSGYGLEYYIYGDGTNPSGCQLRITATSGDTVDTLGEVYNY